MGACKVLALLIVLQSILAADHYIERRKNGDIYVGFNCDGSTNNNAKPCKCGTKYPTFSSAENRSPKCYDDMESVSGKIITTISFNFHVNNSVIRQRLIFLHFLSANVN